MSSLPSSRPRSARGRRETRRSVQSRSVGIAPLPAWTAVATTQSPGPQSRRQRARDADADDAVHAGSKALERRCQAHLIAAARDRLDTRAGQQAPFALQAGDREDRHMP